MTIGIIGAGNMGSALCHAIVSSELTAAEDIHVCDSTAEKLEPLRDELGVTTTTDTEQVLQQKFIILAIKPQQLSAFADQYQGNIAEHSILISILAGVSLHRLHDQLKHEKIVRAMPNTPALVKQGVTGWFTDENLVASEKDQVQELLSSFGYAFNLEKESQMDDLTVISGCGPGFFFALFEAWRHAAGNFDLPRSEIDHILTKTIQGSLELLEQSEQTATELKEQVASKGGATEAGLQVLESSNLETILSKTLQAAYTRCKELE